jgi:hypothetical protein
MFQVHRSGGLRPGQRRICALRVQSYHTLGVNHFHKELPSPGNNGTITRQTAGK